MPASNMGSVLPTSVGTEGYIGIDGKARRITDYYVGVNGVAREVSQIYVGVDGVARLCWIASNFLLSDGNRLVTSDGSTFNVKEPEQLLAPIISLEGNVLTITDVSGCATAFDILVDGSVVASI